MDGISAYRENAIGTQAPGRLIVMLYEGAVKFLKQAIVEIEAGDTSAKGTHIGKAVDIIGELDNVLDTDAGGEVAQDLRRLYHFMIRHLFQANLKADLQMVREVIQLLEELNEGWKVVAD